MLKRQYEALKPYEEQLKCAKEYNFVRMTLPEFNAVMEVYDELYTPLTKSQRNCSNCKMKALKKIAADYFTYQPKGRPSKMEKLGDPNPDAEDAQK